MAELEVNSGSMQDDALVNSPAQTAAETSEFVENDEPIFVKTEIIAEEAGSDAVADLSFYGTKRPRTYYSDSSASSTMAHTQPETQHHFVSSYDDAFERPLVILGDSKWTAPATGMLLDLYIQNQDKFNSPHIKKKLLWRKISEKLNEEGHMFDSDKCERKFLNLKTTYRYTVDHNMQTGNQKRCAFYDQLDSIFQLQSSVSDTSGYKSGNTREDGNDAPPQQQSRQLPQVGVVSTTPPHPAFPVSKATPSMHTSMQYINRLNKAVAGTNSNNPVVMTANQESNAMSQELLHKRQNSPSMNMQSHTEAFSRHNFSRFPHSSSHRNARPNTTSQQSANNNHGSVSSRRPPTYVIDDDDEPEQPSSSGWTDDSETSRFQRDRKRKQTELDYLLATFERYCDEQRDREEKRLKCMKEWHDEEMKVMNRFLDIIQQCIQSGKN